MKRSVSGPPADTSGWFTRSQVASFLGIGISTVIALEKRGRLHVRHEYRADTRGAERRTALYDPKEVTQLPRRERVTGGMSAGELTARACELFREGHTDEDVVVELRETFERIQELREKWLNAGGSNRVIVPAAWEALERLVGPFVDVADLITKLQPLEGAMRLAGIHAVETPGATTTEEKR